MILNTRVGSVQFRTPVLLASGYITETPDFFLAARDHGCAGMVTRSLKKTVPKERANVPAPRYVVFDQSSMLNCEWGNEKPWTSWRDQGVAVVKATNDPIIISLSGRDVEGCCYLIREFDKLGVDAYEINVSCSHSGALHGNLNADVMHLVHLMKQIRGLTTTPIWIKLSYSIIMVDMARKAEELGADAIVCTNSVGPGLIIDTSSRQPKLGILGGGGGVTGKAIFPIALWSVNQLYQAVKIPVVGGGGVSTGDEVIQMLLAGASVVQLYTAPALKGPPVFRKINADLKKYFAQNLQFATVSDLIGAAQFPKVHSFSSPRPVVIEDRCVGCNVCVPACAFNAITMEKGEGDTEVAVINANCISCNACVGVCPPKFDAIKVSFGGSS